MKQIHIIARDMTTSEFEQMNAGFDEHTLDKGVDIQSSDRIGFVALADGQFVGCASGLAYKHGGKYSGWFYLTDLFVEKVYRGQGIGSRLLEALEATLQSQDIHKIWTWTAGYEGPGFYKKQGYEVFAELENWYSNGTARIGMRKEIGG